MTREHNWADCYSFQARPIHRPRSLDEARRIVAAASAIHAIGARHSFNDVADSPRELIDLGGIDPDCSIERDGGAVTVGAGVSYGTLAQYLHAHGRALLNMASLPHITVGGAIATGTHGSGDRLGTLSSAVAGLQLITASGDLITVRRGDAEFDGMVVSLGALGVVARVTLDTQPAFELRQDAFAGLSWDTLRTDLDAVMSAGESVSLMTGWSSPTVDRMWIKTRGTNDDAAATLGLRLAETPMPKYIAGFNPFGVAGPWLDRLPHFMRDVEPGTPGHLQSEYMLPRARAPEAFARLRAIGDRIDQHLLATEIRSMAADTLWLSPACGHDTIAIHFSWHRDIDAVAAMTAEVEALLLPLDGRPHWGKIMHAPADQLAPLYPRLEAFRALAASFDPDGKMVNRFLRRHVLG